MKEQEVFTESPFLAQSEPSSLEGNEMEALTCASVLVQALVHLEDQLSRERSMPRLLDQRARVRLAMST